MLDRKTMQSARAAPKRIHAQRLDAKKRAVVEDIAAARKPPSKLATVRAHGRAIVTALLEQGHLCEAQDGTLFLTPLTARELEAYPPWGDAEIAALRSLWRVDVPVMRAAAELGRAGGDVLQQAWNLGLHRRETTALVPDAAAFRSTPAWRIRRLRAALSEAERRGTRTGDNGADLAHRALRRRFEIGRRHADAKPDRHYRPWTREEIGRLTQMRTVESRTIAFMANELGRTVYAVTTQIQVLGIAIEKRWAYEEDVLLTQLVQVGLSTRRIVESLPGRTVSSVKGRIATLGLTGLRAFTPWTRELRESLAAAVKRGDNIVAWAFENGRSLRGARWQSRMMGLAHPKRTNDRIYTDAERAVIREGYLATPKVLPRVIAARLNRPLSSVYQEAFRMGLTASDGQTSFRRKITPAEVARMRSAIENDNADVHALMRLTKRSRQAVYKILANNGIRLRRGTGAAR